MSNKTICVSGGFDPVHIGHLRMIKEASKFGHVTVIVNSDDWLMRKKGYIFMPFEERCEIIEGFTATAKTTYVDDSDGTVCEALRRIKPDYFANGGDRKPTIHQKWMYVMSLISRCFGVLEAEKYKVLQH